MDQLNGKGNYPYTYTLTNFYVDTGTPSGCTMVERLHTWLQSLWLM
jgi:hypothetical protein